MVTVDSTDHLKTEPVRRCPSPIARSRTGEYISRTVPRKKRSSMSKVRDTLFARTHVFVVSQYAQNNAVASSQRPTKASQLKGWGGNEGAFGR